MIHRRVLESMKPPWFVANEGTHKGVHQGGQNEDWNFCLRAQDQGFRIVCDTNLHIEHIGNHGITPRFSAEWQKQRQADGAGVAP